MRLHAAWEDILLMPTIHKHCPTEFLFSHPYRLIPAFSIADSSQADGQNHLLILGVSLQRAQPDDGVQFPIQFVTIDIRSRIDRDHMYAFPFRRLVDLGGRTCQH